MSSRFICIFLFIYETCRTNKHISVHEYVLNMCLYGFGNACTYSDLHCFAGFHIGNTDFISNVLLQGFTSSFAGSANQGANHCEQNGEGGAHNCERRNQSEGRHIACCGRHDAITGIPSGIAHLYIFIFMVLCPSSLTTPTLTLTMSNYILALPRSLLKSILCRDLNPNPHHNDIPQLLHGSILTLIQVPLLTIIIALFWLC